MTTGISRLAWALLFSVATAVGFAADATINRLRAISGPPFDQEFLRQMIDHHQQGVQLAELAAQNSHRDELRQLATKIATSQQKELAAMETLRTGTDSTASRPGQAATTAPTTSSPDAPPAAPHMVEIAPSADSPEAQAFQATLRRLSTTTGGAFDQAFTREMLHHHRTGLEMAQLARQKASAQAVRELGDQLARSESAEVQELQKFRSQVAPSPAH